MSRGIQNPMTAVAVCIAALALGISGCNPFAGDDGASASDESSQADASVGEADEAAESEAAESESDESESETAPQEGTGEKAQAEPDNESDQESAPALPSLDEDQDSANGTSRRNPFAPQIEISEASRQEDEKEAESMDGRPPLQKYQIGSLRLTAIISEVSVPKAMFIDPAGTGHLAKEGDRVGTEGGRIEDIRANEVVIAMPNGGDEGTQRERVIELREATMKLGQQRGLDSEERRILDELMQSDEGRRALQESYQQMESGERSGQDAGQRAPRRRQQNTRQGSGTDDERFPGLAPPSE
mgnify:CR=1 FL=1